MSELLKKLAQVNERQDNRAPASVDDSSVAFGKGQKNPRSALIVLALITLLGASGSLFWYFSRQKTSINEQQSVETNETELRRQKLHQAHKFLEISDFDKALEIYSGLESDMEKSTLIKINIGYIFKTKKEFEKSTEYYQKALTLEPKNAVLLNNLAMLNFEMGEHEVALTQIDQAIALKADYWQAQLNRGRILEKVNKLDLAMELYEDAYQKNQIPSTLRQSLYYYKFSLKQKVQRSIAAQDKDDIQ